MQPHPGFFSPVQACARRAGRYTPMETTPLGELFPLCAERGIHLVLGGPFNSGFLAGGEH